MEPEHIACKNCEFEYEGQFSFCPHCGQQKADDLTVGVLFYNTISNYFSFDARFFKSFLPLMLRPGLLPKRFVEGKRLLYLHPAQMYLFISVVFFFLFSFVVRDQVAKLDEQMQNAEIIPIMELDSIAKQSIPDSTEIAKIKEPLEDNNIQVGIDERSFAVLDSLSKLDSTSTKSDSNFLGYDSKALDSLIAADAPQEEQLRAMGMKDNAGWFQRRFYTQMLKFQKNKEGGGVLQAFYDSIPIALFILLPIFALILKVFFWRRGSFAHHLVFGFYYYSFLFTVFSILLLTNRFIWEIPSSISWLIVLSTFIYLFLAVKHFYKQGYFLSFIKTWVITFVYMSFVLPIAGIIMVGFAFMVY